MNGEIKGYVMVGLAFALITVGIFSIFEYAQDKTHAEKGVGVFWACMDGCTNMLLVEYDHFSYYNDTMHNLQSACDNLCCTQYYEQCNPRSAIAFDLG